MLSLKTNQLALKISFLCPLRMTFYTRIIVNKRKSRIWGEVFHAEEICAQMFELRLSILIVSPKSFPTYVRSSFPGLQHRNRSTSLASGNRLNSVPEIVYYVIAYWYT